MKKFRKFAILVLTAVLLCSFALTACGGDTPDAGTPDGGTPGGETQRTTLRLLGLKGPTGMGMAKLVSNNASTTFDYRFSVYGAPTDLTPILVKGDYDIAAVPTNLAAQLYKKTNGALAVIAVNTLGVLSVLENGDTIHSFADLAGRDVYYFGQNSTPQYILEYLLAQNHITANLIPVAQSDELATKLVANKTAIGVLPEPSVTSTLAQAKKSGNTGLRIALDLNDAWSAVAETGSAQVQGCFIVRKGFLEQVGEAGITAFLNEYAASAVYAVEHPAEASAQIATLGIVPAAAVAQTALEHLGDAVCCVKGAEMKMMLDKFYDVLLAAAPSSIGGAKPDDAFYFLPAAQPAV